MLLAFRGIPQKVLIRAYSSLHLFGACVQHKVTPTLHLWIPTVLAKASSQG